MNLEILFDKIEESGRIKSSRLRHIRMSVKHYAAALGCPSLKDCSREVYAINKEARNRLIEEHFNGQKSAYLLRNTKNDISFLFRQAEELRLIELPEPSPAEKDGDLGKRKIGRTLPRKVSPGRTGFHRETYGLPIDRWAGKLREQYDDWKTWVSTERVVAGNKIPYNRPATIENKTRKLEAYFGYLFNIKRVNDLDFEMLLDTIFLEEFAYWHLERSKEKVSFQVTAVLNIAASVVRKYYLPKAILADRQRDAGKYNSIATEINDLQKRFKADEQTNNPKIAEKRVSISADDLRSVARHEFPKKQLLDDQPGTVLALNAGRALAIMLMLYYPLRNKNYREAQIGQNIVKNTVGEWVLLFTGDDENAGLKSKQRLKTANVYKRVIAPEAAELLENYINVWRPILTQRIEERIEQLKDRQGISATRVQAFKEHKKYLFLNSNGVPFSRQAFATWVEKGIYRWLGVRINPERIRQISAIEMLNQGKSDSYIAEQLNDVPESVSRIRKNFTY